jgi:hypothetical protein
LLHLRLARAAAIACLLLVALPSVPHAHEVPASVTVLAFVRPHGRVLEIVMRVPLESMRDLEVPLRGPGYLDLARVEPMLRDAARLWLVDYLAVYEGDVRLDAPRIVNARISLPSDRSFETYEKALAHAGAAPLPATTDIPWQQAMLDVSLAYAIQSETARFSDRPALAHLGQRTSTVLRFLPPNGAERAWRFDGDPGLVRLDPRWHQAALTFVRLGFTHILGGLDHLLFVLCLVIPMRRIRALIGVVTAFTVAHSITLSASAFGFAPDGLWFPPLVEALVALSIVLMALDNIVGARVERRWIVAFVFGLVHGFGFSFALRASMQFAGAHLATSLFAFNAGVELGQLLVLAIAIPMLAALFKYAVPERAGTIVLSALVAHTAWHWMQDRVSVLTRYSVAWPAFDLAFVATAMRAAMLAIVVGGVWWALSGWMRKLARTGQAHEVGAD